MYGRSRLFFFLRGFRLMILLLLQGYAGTGKQLGGEPSLASPVSGRTRESFRPNLLSLAPWNFRLTVRPRLPGDCTHFGPNSDNPR